MQPELFQDFDFAEDLEDLKSTSSGTLCVFGNHTRVPSSGKPLRDKTSKKECFEVSNVDFVSSNVKSFHQGVSLNIFENNEAAIKMIIKGRSPPMRHVSRTHRVALHW